MNNVLDEKMTRKQKVAEIKDFVQSKEENNLDQEARKILKKFRIPPLAQHDNLSFSSNQSKVDPMHASGSFQL